MDKNSVNDRYHFNIVYTVHFLFSIHDCLQNNPMHNLYKMRLKRVATCSWVIVWEHKLLHIIYLRASRSTSCCALYTCVHLGAQAVAHYIPACIWEHKLLRIIHLRASGSTNCCALHTCVYMLCVTACAHKG
jgi:hypothetical protein